MGISPKLEINREGAIMLVGRWYSHTYNPNCVTGSMFVYMCLYSRANIHDNFEPQKEVMA
jgi:hypothetical protein